MSDAWIVRRIDDPDKCLYHGSDNCYFGSEEAADDYIEEIRRASPEHPFLSDGRYEIIPVDEEVHRQCKPSRK